MGSIIYKVNNGSKKHPSWALNSVIYELNTRQFTPEGTFNAAMEQLPRLKALGIDIIWMMPIFPIGKERRKGELGSYYSIADYTATNEEFGTLADFCAFVEKAHSLGMYIIVDWVANHTARDARWVAEHPSWYEWDSAKNEIATPFDWSDTAKLDYNSLEMRNEMTSSMKYWLEEAKIDGFRCDMAMLVPLDFWENATKELTSLMEEQGRELFMLAEAEGPEFHKAFDATYSWEEHHILNRISKGEANCYTLGERLGYENGIYNADAMRMHFTSNHDENSWNGSAITRMGGSAEAFAALTFLLSGMPLIYNGQEVALTRSLEFFDRDTINWDNLRSTPRGENMERLYTELCQLKHTHPALVAGDKGGDIIGIDNEYPWQVFAIKRVVNGRVVVGLFNLCAIRTDVRFYDEDLNGEFHEIASHNPTSEETVALSSGMRIEMSGWGFRLFYR